MLRGVGVACARLVGFAVGLPALPGVNGVADWDGASATDGGDMDTGALGGPNRSDVIHTRLVRGFSKFIVTACP